MKRKFQFPVKRSNAWITLPDGSVKIIGSAKRSGDDPTHCFLEKAQFDELVKEFGVQGAKKLEEASKQLETGIEAKYKTLMDGKMTAKEFEDFKKAELKELNDKVIELEKLNKAVSEQGLKINELISKPNGGEKGISFEEFLTCKAKLGKYDAKGEMVGEEEVVLIDRLKELYAEGSGTILITSQDLKKAGVTRFRNKAAGSSLISTSIVDTVSPPGSPYLPGLGGAELEIFDIVRNPNFILNRVDMGRTNQSTLAWINEVSVLADTVAGTSIAEGGTKTLVQHKWQVEFSKAKKAAAYAILSEEFEDDVPQLATRTRRLLQDDVLRAFDDAIQAAVIAAARPYEITGLNGKIKFPTLFDDLGAALAQVGYYNFIPNTLGLNTVTSWQVMMEKDHEGRYNVPPFMDRINRLLVEANKIVVGDVLAGDLTQYKVDIYKDFSLRIGWINDQFIKNLFSIVGEIRYHDYISDSRKKAIVYDQLSDIEAAISAGS